MSESVTTFRCGPMLFIADPGLHTACIAAREMASRCKRSSIEAADLLLGVYYGARTEASELLHMAVKYLRHVEAALRLQERQPISFDALSLLPPTSLSVH